MRQFDLNKLRDWSRANGLSSLMINYSEASDEYEVEVNGPAISERLYMKRCPTVEYFILTWNKQIEQNVQEKSNNENS